MAKLTKGCATPCRSSISFFCTHFFCSRHMSHIHLKQSCGTGIWGVRGYQKRMSFLFKFHSGKDVVSTHVYTWIYHDIPIPNSCRLISIKYHKHWYDSLRKLCYLQLKCMLGIWNQKCQGWKVVFCSLQQVATQNSDLHILIFDTLITKVTKVTSFVPSASLCTRNLNYSSSSLWLVGWLVVLHHQAADSAT